MITIYNVLKDLFTVKTGKLINDPSFNDAFVSNYMIQRWVSMESPVNAYLVNETTNKLWKAFENNKEMLYKLYTVLIKKQSFKKIPYIKKAEKKVNEKTEKLVEHLALKNQISKREVEEHLDMLNVLNIDTERYKKYV